MLTLMSRTGHQLLKTLLLLPIFAAIGFIAGDIDGQYMVGFILATLLILGGVAWVYLTIESAERLWALKLFLAAFVIRASLGFFLPLIWPSFEVPDGIHYALDSAQLANAWHIYGFTRYESVIQFPLQAYGYVYLNTAVFFLFGAKTLYIQLFNSLFAALSAIYAYKIGKHFFGARPARFGAFLTAFMPSMILWTSQNLKDSSVLLLSLMALWNASQGLSWSIYRLPFLSLIITVLATIRKETAIGIAVVIALTIVFQQSTYRLSRVIASTIGIIVIGWTTATSGYGFLGIEFAQERLSPESMTAIRERTALGGSAVETGIDTTTLGGFVSYIPLAVANFLLRPWPWEATGSFVQIMTIPESLIWYPLFGFAVFGFIEAIKRSRARTSLIWVYTLAATIAAAPQYGNLGTAYRHRVQLWPCFFLLAGYGWYVWRAKHRALDEPALAAPLAAPAEGGQP